MIGAGTKAVAVVGQGLQDAAVAGGAAAAGVRHAGQLGTQRLQPPQLALHRGELAARQGMDLLAGALRMVGQRQQRPHGFEGEAELPGVADEVQALQVRPAVGAVPAPVRAGGGSRPTSSYRRIVCTLQRVRRPISPMLRDDMHER